MLHVLQRLCTGDQVSLLQLPTLVGVVQKPLIRTGCASLQVVPPPASHRAVNAAALLFPAPAGASSPNSKRQVTMETSTWKCSARRTHSYGIQQSEALGICPRDFSVGDFSVWVCSPAVKRCCAAPRNVVPTATQVTVPQSPWCARDEEAPCPPCDIRGRTRPGREEPRFK